MFCVVTWYCRFRFPFQIADLRAGLGRADQQASWREDQLRQEIAALQNVRSHTHAHTHTDRHTLTQHNTTVVLAITPSTLTVFSLSSVYKKLNLVMRNSQPVSLKVQDAEWYQFLPTS